MELTHDVPAGKALQGAHMHSVRKELNDLKNLCVPLKCTKEKKDISHFQATQESSKLKLQVGHLEQEDGLNMMKPSNLVSRSKLLQPTMVPCHRPMQRRS